MKPNVPHCPMVHPHRRLRLHLLRVLRTFRHRHHRHPDRGIMIRWYDTRLQCGLHTRLIIRRSRRRPVSTVRTFSIHCIHIISSIHSTRQRSRMLFKTMLTTGKHAELVNFSIHNNKSNICHPKHNNNLIKRAPFCQRHIITQQ